MSNRINPPSLLAVPQAFSPTHGHTGTPLAERPRWPRGAESSESAHAAMERWSEELDLRALLAEFGSCLWIVSEAQLRRNHAAWTRLAGHAARVCYPVKANPSPAVLEILATLGARAECASAAEILLARLAGFTADRIVYGSPVADAETAWRLLGEGGTVVADSAELLEALDRRLVAAGLEGDGSGAGGDALASGRVPGRVPGRVFVRVNPAIDIRYRRNESWSELTAHARRTGKFGIAGEEVVDVLQRLTALRVQGLHAHVGTQMDHAEPFVALAMHFTELASSIEAATPHRIEVLDLGGGLGIPFTEGDCFPSIEALAARLAPQLSPRFEHWFEPGHALVGNAVALLGSVAAIKSTRGTRWTIADIGTDQLAKVTLLDWRHRILTAGGRALPMTGNDALGGPLCFSGDTLLPTTDTSGLAVGDPILVQHAGAYCAALASTFNGRRSGGTVVVRADGSIVRTGERAGVLDEPLARGHAWGLAAGYAAESPVADARRIRPDAIAALTSRVLREQLCEERWDYREAIALDARSHEFTLDVRSPVGFVSMPLAIRLAGDAAIVSVLSAMGFETKAFPVWGTALDLRMLRQVRTDRPVRVRIEVSHEASRGGPGAKRLAVRFAMWNVDDEPAAARGSFEIVFDAPGTGC